jgi:hypothetical protein
MQTFSSLRRVARRPSVAAPTRFAAQIQAAERVAPAETYRGQVALLLSCGSAMGREAAERALRDVWPVEVVHHLHCPIPCWSEALSVPPGAESWLQHYLMRELATREPSLVAVLDTQMGEQPTGRGFVSLLRRWGVGAPVALLRCEARGGMRELAPAVPAEGMQEEGRC